MSTDFPIVGLLFKPIAKWESQDKKSNYRIICWHYHAWSLWRFSVCNCSDGQTLAKKFLTTEWCGLDEDCATMMRVMLRRVCFTNNSRQQFWTVLY